MYDSPISISDAEFVQAINELARPHVAPYGFMRPKLKRRFHVLMCNRRIELRFSVYSDWYCPLEPQVVVRELSAADDRYTQIPAWFLIPESEPAHRYSEWRFFDLAGLRASFARVATEVVAPRIAEWQDSAFMSMKAAAWRRHLESQDREFRG